MKICVYTIAKNEEKFCQRWADSCRDADGMYVLDTGSSDDTAMKLSKLGVHTRTQPFDPWQTLAEYDALVTAGKNPWRFDTARNIALDMIPEDTDICVILDIDEELVPGWRKIIEQTWKPGESTEIRHKYAWSMNGDQPGHVFVNSRVHARKNYAWVNPVHEVQKPVTGSPVCHFTQDLLILHKPDGTKSRGQYLGLLQLAARENPLDPKTSFYLGREYSFHNRNLEAIQELQRYLSIPGNGDTYERATACELISNCIISPDTEKEKWLFRSLVEQPLRRETWIALSEFYRLTKQHHAGYGAAMRGLEIRTRPYTYLDKPEVWGSFAYDSAANNAYWAGMTEEAKKLAFKALEQDSFDQHLIENYELCYYQDSLKKAKSKNRVDVIILSNASDPDKHKMTQTCIDNLILSSPDISFQIMVVETNEVVSGYMHALTRTPNVKFSYNKYLQIGFYCLEEQNTHSDSLLILNNDITCFCPDFVQVLAKNLSQVNAVFAYGLREGVKFKTANQDPLQVNYEYDRYFGWCMLIDKKIFRTVSFDKFFPAEISFYYQDGYFTDMLEYLGYKHGLSLEARALHLQAATRAPEDREDPAKREIVKQLYLKHMPGVKLPF